MHVREQRDHDGPAHPDPPGGTDPLHLEALFADPPPHSRKPRIGEDGDLA
jgi:hypothetical protein